MFKICRETSIAGYEALLLSWEDHSYRAKTLWMVDIMEVAWQHILRMVKEEYSAAEKNYLLSQQTLTKFLSR